MTECHLPFRKNGHLSPFRKVSFSKHAPNSKLKAQNSKPRNQDRKEMIKEKSPAINCGKLFCSGQKNRMSITLSTDKSFPHFRLFIRRKHKKTPPRAPGNRGTYHMGGYHPPAGKLFPRGQKFQGVCRRNFWKPQEGAQRRGAQSAKGRAALVH